MLLARLYLRNGDGASAEKELRRAQLDGVDIALTEVPLAEAFLLQRKYTELLREFPRGGREQSLEGQMSIIRGNAMLELGDPDSAYHDFDDATLMRPDDVFPILGLARVALSRGEFDRATQLVATAVQLDPDVPDVWYVAGETERAVGHPQNAIRHYSKVLQITPQHVPALIARAALRITLQRYDSALADLEVARDIDANDPQAAFFHAQVFAQQGDLTRALQTVREANTILLSLDPSYIRKHASTQLTQGLVQYSLGQLDDALTTMWAYVKANPNHFGARKLLAGILLKKGDPAIAIKILNPALQAHASDPSIKALVGVALVRDGRHEEGLRLLGEAIELAPDATGYRTELAKAQLDMGYLQEALTLLDATLDLDVNAQQPARLLGLTQLQNQLYDDADHTAQRLLANNPSDPFALCLRAAAHAGRGDYASARQGFRAAANADAGYLSAFFNLGELELRIGNHSKAIDAYESVLQVQPKNQKALMALAAIAVALRNFEHAIGLLERAHKAAPGDYLPQIALVEVYLSLGRTDEAFATAAAAREAHSLRLPVLDAYGRAALAENNPRVAGSTFIEMTEIARHSASDLQRIAQLQMRVPDYSGADKTLQRALFVKPDHVGALSTLIDVEIRVGRDKDALKHIAEIRQRLPDAALADRALGDLLLKQRDYTRAISAYRTAMRKSPAATHVLRLHIALRDAGQQQEALQVLDDWMAKHPRDTGIRHALAAAYLQAGKVSPARELYEELLAAAPTDAAILNNLAWLYFQSNDERALDIAERAYKIAASEATVIDTFGWISFQSGDTARGLTLLREAHVRASQNLEIRYHLAAALVQLGQTDEAQSHLDAVLAGEVDAAILTSAKRLRRTLH